MDKSDSDHNRYVPRIEWTRLAADDVEQTVAILLARENPEAQRIRPSLGDGGIDVLVPATKPSTFDVYQVKCFSQNLTTSQKSQIRRSFERLVRWSDEHDIQVASWYLTLPLEPTHENRAELTEWTEDAPFSCEWRGLAFLEGLASSFPEVIDYYLHDGKDRLQAAVATLSDLLRQQMTINGSSTGGAANTGGPLSPAHARSGLAALYEELNRYDPHYRYEFAVSERRQLPPPEPELVFAYQNIDGSPCVTYKVFSRFRESELERPIPINFGVSLDPDSPEAAEWEDLLMYGTGADAPIGSTRVSMDLPGGLGGEFEGAGIRVGPNQAGVPYELRLEVLNPDGRVHAMCRLNMGPPTRGLSGPGVGASGRESEGVFSIALRARPDDLTGGLSVQGLDLTGLLPDRVLPGLKVLAAWRAPNAIRFALPHGPAPESSFPLDESGSTGRAEAIRDLAASLSSIQGHTRTQLRMPAGGVSLQQLRHFEFVARLLAGEEVQRKWTVHPSRLSPEVLTTGPARFTLYEPLRVEVGDDVIDLGFSEIEFTVDRVEVEPDAAADSDGLLAVTLTPSEAEPLMTIRFSPVDRLAAAGGDS